MPCGNDSFGIKTFTTMMLSIYQIISWIALDRLGPMSEQKVLRKSFFTLYKYKILLIL